MTTQITLDELVIAFDDILYRDSRGICVGVHSGVDITDFLEDALVKLNKLLEDKEPSFARER